VGNIHILLVQSVELNVTTGGTYGYPCGIQG